MANRAKPGPRPSPSSSPLSSALGQSSGGEVGGYPYEFLVEPPISHRCGICTKILRDPHLTGCCGHEFCQTCLERWRKSSEKRICPHCRAEKFEHMLNKRTKREISLLKVRCVNSKQGCGWTGELLDAENHLRVCGYVEVQCDKCILAMKRKDLEKHKAEECGCRASKCMYCGQEDAYWVIVSLGHLSQCPGYPVNCPNVCGVSGIKRSLMPAHQITCPYEVVECPFKDVGCPTRLPQKDMRKHSEMADQQHLQDLMLAFQQVKSSLTETQKQVTMQGQQLKELRLFRATLEGSMKEVASEVDNLLTMQETTVKQSTVLHSIRSLAATSVLRLNKEHPVISLKMGQYISYVQPSPATVAVPTSAVTNPPASTTRTIVKPGHAPPNTGDTSPSTGKSGVWKSQAFYVGDGYKVCLQAAIIGGSLSVKLLLQRGELDSDLHWPCRIEFSCIHLSLVSRNHFGALRCCLGAANDGSGAVLNTSLPMSAFTTEQVIWQNEKFARCPLPLQCVLEDGSIIFRLSWIERKTMHFSTFSPGKEESRLVLPGVRRRWSGQRSSWSDESQDGKDIAVPGFTFIYSRPSPAGSRSSLGMSPGQGKAAGHED